jgi:hypothetical protein
MVAQPFGTSGAPRPALVAVVIAAVQQATRSRGGVTGISEAYGTRSIAPRLRGPARRSKSSCRAVICVYAGFLILHQLVLVPSALYRPLPSLATIPSRSCAHATWKKALPRASTWSHTAAASALTGSSAMRACVVAVEGRAPFLAHVARVLDKVIATGRSQ